MARLPAALGLAILLLAPLFGAAPATDAAGQGRWWSTIADGPFAVLPATPQTFVASDGTPISYAVHMPDVPAGTRVPVILSAGPYFGLLEEPVHLPSSTRLTGFLIDNFVSHGYAVVAASVRGTGLSGGCMELMSEREARDLDELVTFLATQPWSNGRVGMTGKSYDGATPWMVAQFGNPHLKTIVPIAGVTDEADLLVHHGVPQWRTPFFHSLVYWPFGFGVGGLGGPTDSYPERPAEHRLANLACPEAAEGAVAGVWSALTGDTATAPGVREYWAERAWREPTIRNYNGSVFVVHGLQDFNVVPHMVVPFFNDLPVEKKMLLGQWAHHYPDEGARARWAAYTPRWDFASTMKTWFDRHLKEMDVDTGPVVEVADAVTGQWRSVSAWPLPPVETKTWWLGPGRLHDDGPRPFRAQGVTPAGAWMETAPCEYTAAPRFTSDPVPAAFRFSGIGTLDLTLDPALPGSVVAALCVDGRVIAHGATSTLYADATNEPKPFVPGTKLPLRIEFEPVEATIRQGARVVLVVHVDDFTSGREGGDYWPSASPGVVVLTAGELRLPVA